MVLTKLLPWQQRTYLHANILHRVKHDFAAPRALQNGFVFSFRSSQQKWQGRTAPAKVKPSNKHDSCCGVNPLIDTSAASENGPARTSLSPRSEDHFKTARELDVIGLFPHGFNMVSRIFKNLGPTRPNSLDPVELPEAVLPRHGWLPAKNTVEWQPVTN